ncbi:GIY-YIG nuclease family protein [Clostridium sp.]|uniref:GIY-YIG nuclease family protein n=1 Tax=Clostridium sp. TaxID=1506 RepID=UPI00284F8309|nr:GIY-YIG nuclease family protein [Clostridium sp.]MDR3596496.1 GIY-YIG nuclease family protein [Clostridium sp.]MDR3680480.1 GIY-YIG nuclease family protein [Flavipsychrobacter sp.]
MTEKVNMCTKGTIYKIVNDVNDEIYVGSTCKSLSNRMSNHRSASRDPLKYKDRKIYTAMRDNDKRFDIILLESFPCKTKDELHAREHHYITTLKPTLNGQGAILDIENRKVVQKNWRDENFDSRKEYADKYRLEHLDKIRKQKLEWSRQRVICEVCNLNVCRGSLSKHLKQHNKITV